MRSLKPVNWLEGTSHKPSLLDPDFTVGQIRSLRWQMWWMKYLPYRTYPVLPFKKQVHWNWRRKKLTLPLPWAKDLFKELKGE